MNKKNVTLSSSGTRVYGDGCYMLFEQGSPRLNSADVVELHRHGDTFVVPEGRELRGGASGCDNWVARVGQTVTLTSSGDAENHAILRISDK